MRVQLCLSLVLYLMQNIEGVHASVPDLTSLITTSCNGQSDSDDLGSVEVTITQQNLRRLNLTSVEELRLLDSNPDCKPLPCCGGSSWNWQFSEESLCGGQLKVQVQEYYEIVTLGNVLYVDGNGSNMGDAKSWMALIACSFLTNISLSGMNAPPLSVAIPAMNWSLFRTDFYPEESQRITLNPSTYVGNWKGGGWLQLDINPSNQYELEDLYTGVHFTVNRYNLNFVHEQKNGSNTTEVKPLIKNGCPPNSDLNFFFSGGTAHHEQVVAVVINLLDIAKLFARSNVRYMYLTFNISLCRDHGITAYRQLPECQGYSGLNCYQSMGEPSPSHTVAYTSGLLTIWDPNPSNASRTPEPSRQTSVVSDTDTTTEFTTTTASPSPSKQTVEEENESSDNTDTTTEFTTTTASPSPSKQTVEEENESSDNTDTTTEFTTATASPSPSKQTVEEENESSDNTDTTTEFTTTTASPSPSKQTVEEENESSDNTDTTTEFTTATASPSPSKQTVEEENESSDNTDTTTEFTTTTASPSPSKQTVEEENESSDNTVNLKSYVVAIVCVSCFICGCTLIGVIWMMYSHRRRIADLQGDSLSANQGSKYVRYDKSSLESGILDSPLGSPVGGYCSTDI